MESVVISLARHKDRLEKFIARNSQYLGDIEVFSAIDGNQISQADLDERGLLVDLDWRDPIKKRSLTKGEVGCFLSHFDLWQRAHRTGQTLLILEDDAGLTGPLPDDIEEQAADGLLYLLWNEMNPEGSSQDGELIRPCYPYWTCAYVVTPEGAKRLIDAVWRVIPVDEFIPRCTDRLRVRGLPNAPIELMRTGSSTEPRSANDYWVGFKTHALTVASDLSKAEKLTSSAAACGFEVTNLWPEGKDWNGGLQNYKTGGGIKLNLLKEHLKSLPGSDLVVFTDAYDVFFCGGLAEITKRFLDFKCEVVVQAERALWPDCSQVWPPCHTPYRYACSGVIVGRVAELRCMLAHELEPSESDQHYLQEQILTGRYDVRLDHEMYLSASHELNLGVKNGVVFNPVTRCSALIAHGNGGAEAKAAFELLYRQAYPKLEFAMHRKYEKLGDEMLLIDYKTPEQCAEWIAIGEAHGGWAPHPADTFPSHDIHLKELGLWEEAEAFFKKVAGPIANEHWTPSVHQHLRKAFVMKYSPDTQKTLGLHCDSSQITGSVKLNDDYEGATLHWPRQGITNKDIPVGKMILFPGMVTHGHYVDELKSGTKYSATFWTARFKGEYL